MNKKGFIFTITALHYVGLFLLFLSLFVFLINKPVIVDSMNSAYSRNIIKFNSMASNSYLYTNGWCSTHMRYELNSDFDNQSNLSFKHYCESYGK
jgi:hypothetical protein